MSFWIKNSNNGQYFDFLKLDLSSNYFTNKVGVYVIWYSTPNEAKAIYAGQGNIGERLRDHRNNPKITQYASQGQLKVTWGIIDDQTTRDRVEVGLYQQYKPLEVERTPNVLPQFVEPI